ncbi:MAG: PEP-CTERM sorting domain-containing protein [Planctomycetes bacterium]|nr:PEP-CTERM sorting domain-containing protein [Planctomycetota bacterium]
MTKRAVFFALLACSAAFAQGTFSLDVLDPSETSGTIPDNFKIVDVYVDIAETDVWTGTGIRVIALRGARLNYDPNSSSFAPLINPGTSDKFYTSLSRPRGRDDDARFNNGAAAVAGTYNPPGPWQGVNLTELNVAYFAVPPATSTSPSVDGYIARISIDVSRVGAPSGAAWYAGDLGTEPPDAVFVLRSEPPPPPNSQTPGTVLATFDVPAISGIDWGLWYLVPEPTSLILISLLGVAACRRR